MKRIIKSISGMEKATEHEMPAATTSFLTKDKAGRARQNNWNYRLVIRMLNVLVNSTHLELAHAVHQCDQFCEDPEASYEMAVKKHVIRYLLTTQERNGRSEPAYGLNMRLYMNR
eukprot:3260365-Ditylum_brightwellii.AAC.1